MSATPSSAGARPPQRGAWQVRRLASRQLATSRGLPHQLGPSSPPGRPPEVLSTTNWPLMILISVVVMAACGVAGFVLNVPLALGFTCKLLYDRIVELCGSCKGGSPPPEAEPLND